MSEFVVLVLDGTHQHWSDQSVGYERVGKAFPTRSGVGGLVAAALGLQRTDPRIDGLHAGIRVSSRILKTGTSRKEYSNIRLTDDVVEKQPDVKEWNVPYGDNIYPRQTWRWYLTDAAFQVAVEVLPSSPFTAGEILAALRAPLMPLYLGRKYCRLNFPPVGPTDTVKVASSPIEVMAEPWNTGLREGLGLQPYLNNGTMFLDGDDPNMFPGESVPYQVGDVLLCNTARSFSTRLVYLWNPPVEAGEEGDES